MSTSSSAASSGGSSGAGVVSNISTLVHPTLRAIMANLNGDATPDVTGLSALAYLKCDNTALSESSVKAALAYISENQTSSVGAPGACSAYQVTTEARDLIATALVGLLPTSSMIQGNSESVANGILVAFYTAARDATCRYMRMKMNIEAGWSSQLTVADEVVIAKWFDDLKENLEQNELPDYANSNDQSVWTVYSNWMQMVASTASAYLRYDLQSATSNLGMMTSTTSSTYNSRANDIIATLYANFSPATLDTIVNVSMRPWLSLYFINQFAKRPEFSIHTQVYASLTMFDAAARAIDKLCSTYPSTSVPAYINLAAIRSALTSMLPTNTLNIDSQAQTVLTEAANNRKASQQLATLNTSMKTRLTRSLDLQVRFQVLDSQVEKQKQLMLLWMVALGAVLVSSTLLIMTDRLTAFMLLAAVSFTIVTAMIILPSLYLLVKRRANVI